MNNYSIEKDGVMLVSANKCRKVIHEQIASQGRIIILYHWDVDGISSSTIMLRYLLGHGLKLTNIVNVVPRIGEYNVNAIDAERIKQIHPNIILILDYSLKQWDLEVLERELDVPILLIDHHLNVYRENLKKTMIYNPVVASQGRQYYPSTTWVLRELLDLSINFHVILGVVGDVGVNVVDHSMWGEIEGYLNSRGWSLEDFTRACETLDSLSRALNLEAVEKAPYKLLKYNTPYDVVDDKEWANIRGEVEKELAKLLKSIEPEVTIDSIKVFRFRSRYLLVSAIGRTLARKYRDSIVVVVFTVENRQSYIYVRSYKYDLSLVLEELRKEGLNVGGKREVFSVQLKDEEQVEPILTKITSLLKRLFRI